MSSPDGGPSRTIAAHTIVGIAGLVAVAGTFFLWWAGSWSDKSDPEVGREIFGNIPPAVVAMFYFAVAAFTGIMFYLFAERL